MPPVASRDLLRARAQMKSRAVVVFLWSLMFHLQLGFGPCQRCRGERGSCVWTEWRCSNALLHPTQHPHRGAPVLGAGSRGVPHPGGPPGAGQAPAAAGRAPRIPAEFHLRGPRQPSGLNRGRTISLF